MIRAQLTLTDGKTPGQWRKGAAVILACIARGCRIVPNDRNDIPDEWAKYMVDTEDDGPHVVMSPYGTLHTIAAKPKRGRPKKVKS